MSLNALLHSSWAWARRSKPEVKGSGGMREFFRYHGILAPGVRLMRALPFAGKAALVAGAFLLPLVVISGHYVESSSNQYAHIAQARAALRYSTHLHELVGQLQLLRRARFYMALGLPVPPDASQLSLSDQSRQLPGLLAPLIDKSVQAELALPAAVRLLVDQAAGCVQSLQANLVTDVQKGQSLAPPVLDAQLRPNVMPESACIRQLLDAQFRIVQQTQVNADGDVGLMQFQALVLDDLPQLEEDLISIRGLTAILRSGSRDPVFWRSMGSRLSLAAAGHQRAVGRMETYGGYHPALRAYAARPLWSEVQQVLAGVSQLGLTEPGAADAAPVDAQMGRLAEVIALAHHEGMAQLALDLDNARQQLIVERTTVAVIVVILVLVAVYLLTAFYRVMHGGLNMLQSQVGRMASGDLSSRPQPWGRDEVAQALYSLGTSLARLADLFAAVRQGVAAVSHASREIAGGNLDLTQRTECAAQAIEQVLQGVTGYTEQLDECGRQIDQAVEVVEAMRLDAVRSRSRMAKLDERMRSLKGRSQEIGEIVELIDNIAFRTNILALNASVEAAKAGEAGRGFAVVAQEVRSLAQRSAESARRISDIIGRSTDDIAQGSDLTDLAVEALKDTDQYVARIHETMQEIVSLTRAGQQSSQDILAEIRGLSSVTQENTRLVGQMEEASRALSTQGDHLSEKVSTFKLT
jgi:methyl-accepting chemotaxis protein-1 (serine sensor receptor)